MGWTYAVQSPVQRAAGYNWQRSLVTFSSWYYVNGRLKNKNSPEIPFKCFCRSRGLAFGPYSNSRGVSLCLFGSWLVPHLWVGIMTIDPHRKAICPVVHHTELQGNGRGSQSVLPSLSFKLRLVVCPERCCPIAGGLSSVWKKSVRTGGLHWREAGRQLLLTVAGSYLLLLTWPVAWQNSSPDVWG